MLLRVEVTQLFMRGLAELGQIFIKRLSSGMVLWEETLYWKSICLSVSIYEWSARVL